MHPGFVRLRVTVTTGKAADCGTDCGVFMRVFGTEGAGETVRLDAFREVDVKPFQRGGVDRFTIDHVAVGSPLRVSIWHDNRGAQRDWLLDKVTVVNLAQPWVTYEFPCGTWLSMTKADQKIRRDLLVGETPRSQEEKRRARRGCVC